jgi:hypothetical protein
MQDLIKKEIKSLENIRDFGMVTLRSSPIDLERELKLPFYPPPAFYYAFRPSNKLVKLKGKIKAFIKLNDAQAESGYVKGKYNVILLNKASYKSMQELKKYFRPRGPDINLYAVALSRNVKLVELTREYLHGTVYVAEFKTPHEINKLEIPEYDAY